MSLLPKASNADMDFSKSDVNFWMKEFVSEHACVVPLEIPPSLSNAIECDKFISSWNDQLMSSVRIFDLFKKAVNEFNAKMPKEVHIFVLKKPTAHVNFHNQSSIEDMMKEPSTYRFKYKMIDLCVKLDLNNMGSNVFQLT